MSENKVLKRIFGPVRVEVTGGLKKQYTNELHNLYSVIRIIKFRRVRWVGHVACT